MIIKLYEDTYRDDLIFMVLQAKDALGRKPSINEDLLDIQGSYFDRGDLFWVAVNEVDRVVGCVGYSRTDTISEAFLHRLYVKASEKRKGIGAALLRTAEEAMRDRGITVSLVHLGEPKEQWFESYAFYPKHGYVEYAPRYMRKELRPDASVDRETPDRGEQIAAWKAEESIARIHGWDFSHITGRYTEQDDLPWDYRSVIGQYLTPRMHLLDIDTGGGEFLLSLHHPYEKTAATENYPPNVQLCREVLSPLGIDFRPGDGKGTLPFDDSSFDLVIDRHGDFNAQEIYRVLKSNGVFITQQVGAENDRELVELLCGETEIPFPEQYLSTVSQKFEDAGFTILRGEECFRPIRFFDTGALVWFARIIAWEFPLFSVETHLGNLIKAQQILEKHGSIDGTIHRFLLVAQK